MASSLISFDWFGGSTGAGSWWTNTAIELSAITVNTEAFRHTISNNSAVWLEVIGVATRWALWQQFAFRKKIVWAWRDNWGSTIWPVVAVWDSVTYAVDIQITLVGNDIVVTATVAWAIPIDWKIFINLKEVQWPL